MLMRSKGKQRANFPRRGKYREAGIGVHFHRRSPVGMFSPRAKGAAFRFYHKRRPSIFQGAHHRCEAAYKICGKAPTTTLPPFWYCVPPFHPHIGRATKGKRLYFLVSP